MPWTWELCLYCMDMQAGTFLNWPYPRMTMKGVPVLSLMRTTWRSWLYHQRRKNPKITELQEWEILFIDWYNEGREELPTAPSAAEQWAMDQLGHLDD